MRRLAVVVFAAGLMVSNSAYAWFFFFIPGSATRSVADTFTGAKGNICVKEGTQLGQILTAGNGNTAKVLSLSGTSSICPNPAQPIRAELAFTYAFSSQAGIDLTDDYQPNQLTDLERFNGMLLKATSKTTRNRGLQISATTKKPNLDIEAMANNLERSILNNQKLKDMSTGRTEKLSINGAAAVRFELSGTLTGIFGQRITYQYTIMETANEIVLINVYAPADYMESNRQELQKTATLVTGLKPAELSTTSPVAPALSGPPPAIQAGSALDARFPTAQTQATEPPLLTPIAAAAPFVTPPMVFAEKDKSSLAEQRLERLSKLLKDGLISQSEFNAKKKEILKDL